MTRLLILSFSPIRTDARVLKQVEEFAGDHEVVTCGYGPAPDGVAEHIRLPEEARVDVRNPKLVLLRWHRALYRSLPGIRIARGLLRGREFDVVLANDVDSVGLALSLRPRLGVHADLHEYSPRLHDEDWRFRLFLRPFYRWMCRRHVSRAASWSTVSGGLAAEYEREFGFRPVVVTNATPYRDAVPTGVGAPIRLVHSGAGLRNRQLELTVRAVAQVPSVTLDLFLTPNDPVYLEELRALAAGSDGRVRVHDPVPYAELVERVAQFDVGVFVLPPVNSSYRWALPNKLFDFVQARLGIVVGPSPEMASYVERYGLGVVTAGFSVEDIVESLRALTPEAVAAYKQNADVHAQELSAQSQIAIWRHAIDTLLAQR